MFIFSFEKMFSDIQGCFWSTNTVTTPSSPKKIKEIIQPIKKKFTQSKSTEDLMKYQWAWMN